MARAFLSVLESPAVAEVTTPKKLRAFAAEFLGDEARLMSAMARSLIWKLREEGLIDDDDVAEVLDGFRRR